MTDIVLHTAVKVESVKDAVTNRLSHVAARLREEGGQDMIEYAGVLVLVAIILAAVVAVFKGGLLTTVGQDISHLVKGIMGGSQTGPASS
jgi:Flp pilus assembly pilin Flp